MNMKKRKINWSVLLIVLFVTGLASCSTDRTREEKVSAIIGKIDSPFFVANMSPGNIIEKSGVTDGALPYTQEMLLSFFIDEEITGVDYDVDVQIVMGKGGGYTPNFYGIFKIKNELAFKDLLEAEANAEINEKDGFSYAMKESDSYVVVWNDEFAVATSIPMDLAAMFSGGSKEGMKTVDKTIELIKSAEEGEINTEYQAFLENVSDISMRFKGEPFYEYMEEMSMGMNDELTTYKETFDGMSVDFFLNFTNGSVDLQVLADLSDELREQINFFNSDPVDSKLFAYGNSKNPMFTLAYNVDLTKGIDYTKGQMSDNEYNELEEQLTEMGIDLENAKTGLTGDILFVVDRVDVKTEIIDWGYGDPYESKQPSPIFGLILGIEDVTVLTSLLEASDSIGEGVMKKGDAFLVIADEVLFSTNDSLWAVKVKNGGATAVSDRDGVLSSEPFALFLDFIQVDAMDDLDEAEAIVNELKALKLTGNIDEMNFSLMMSDDSRNALRILTETIGGLSEGEGSGEEYENLRNELDEAAAETESIEN